MAEWIRVRDTSGHEISVRGDVPDGHPRGIQPGQKRLDKPATNSGGEPLPPKLRLPLGEPLPGGATEKRRARSQNPVPAADPEAGENGHQADPDKEK
jgi:hypothetical protein